MGTLDFGPFLSLSPARRARILGSSEPVTFSPGDTLVREGDLPGDVFALASGRVRVMTGDRLRTLTTMAAPALVGEMALVLGQPRNATVVATVASTGARIPKELLLEAIAADPQFARELEAFAKLRAATNFLRRDSPFADLPSEAIADLAARLEPVTFAAGDLILRQGERGDDAYLLRDGDVDVVRVQEDVQRIVGQVTGGAFLGEVSVLTGMARSASARATTPVRAFRVAGADVRQVVKKYRQVVARLESTMQANHSPRRTDEARVTGAPDDPSSVILHEPKSGTYLRLSREGHAIYEDLDGDRNLRELAMRHAERTRMDDPAVVFATVATLQAAGLVTSPRIAGDQPDARIMRLLDLVLAPRLELKDADPLASALHRVLRPVFSRIGGIVAVVIGLVGGVALARTFREASPADFGLGGLAVAFVGLAIAGIGHEAAHAIATKAEGRRVGRAGVGLMMFTPVIWVDTSDAWFIGRTRRAYVNAAGPLFNFALAGIFGIGAALSSGRAQDLAVWLAITNLISVVFNLSPLLEFDGYYVLADLANVNALRRKALRFVFGELVRHPRRPRSRLEGGFVAYAVAATLYVLVMTLIVLTGVPSIVDGIVPASVGAEIQLLTGAGVALLMATMLVGPFVLEITAARTTVDSAATHAERLEERISKTDLSAAISAKTSSPILRAPSETRR